jgi:GLPGLI family protein
MNKLIILTIYIAAFTALKTSAQNVVFLKEGKIEFEKRINLYAQIDEDNSDEADDSWKTLQKKTLPNFKTSYFNLYFKNDKTLYEPGKENPDNNKIWPQPAEDNTISNDLDKGQSISQKRVFEELFLVNDSTRKIKWKLTDETRTIAGQECRRANAIIMDSIYVVAFYTDAITTTGGPESFNGLPGMILGVALPHEHITWFATKIYAEPVTDDQLKAPTKGKKVNNKTLLTTMNDSLKDWGKYGKKYIKATML